MFYVAHNKVKSNIVQYDKGDYVFGGQKSEKEKVSKSNLVSVIEELLDDQFNSIDSLFLVNEFDNSTKKWAKTIYGLINHYYDFKKEDVKKEDV